MEKTLETILMILRELKYFCKQRFPFSRQGFSVLQPVLELDL